jgi:hypothetical protein
MFPSYKPKVRSNDRLTILYLTLTPTMSKSETNGSSADAWSAGRRPQNFVDGPISRSCGCARNVLRHSG